MKKLSLVALLVVLSACKGQQTEGEAIHARVVLDASVSATCVLFEVRDPASHGVLKQQWLPRASNELQVAIFRGSLPTDVELAARPYRDGDCQGGTQAQTANGVYVTGAAAFVTGQITQANPLTLQPGQDADGDGYVSTASGGSDCDDSSSGAQIHPGVTETCSDQDDLNCDGKRGCEAATCSANMCIGPPATLALTLPGTPVPAGTCTQGTVSVQDANGATSRASAPLPVSLAAAPSAGLAFYADAACTAPVSSVTIGMHEGTAGFYFDGRAAGSVTVSASASGLTTAMQSVQIIPGAGNRLVFTSLSRTVTAGSCSAQVLVQSQDAQGNAAPVTVSTPISLSAAPATNFKFYSDASCTTEIASANLAASSSTVGFYFKGSTAGNVTVTATASGFTGNSQLEIINAGPPTVVALMGAQSVMAGNCSSLPVTVELHDSQGNLTSATSNTTINLTASGKPLTFSTSNTCAPTTTSLSILTGASTASFYFTGTQAGSSTLNAAASGMMTGTLAVTVNAGPATQLVFTTGAQTLTVGSCSAVTTVQLRDANGNPAKAASDMPVGLVASPPDGFQFFSDSSCAGAPVTMVNLPSGASDASFYFQGTRSGTVGVTATVGAISNTQNETLNPGAPSKLVLSAPQQTVTAAACATVNLQVQDSNGNASPVSGNQSVGLSANPSAGFTFYTNSGCTGPTSSITVNSGQSGATFYVKGTAAGDVLLTASKAPWMNGTLTLTVNPAPASQVVFKTAAQNVVQGVCSAITTVQLQDPSGNPSPPASDTTVNVSANPSGTTTFYMNSDCTGPTSTFTVLANQSTTSFYFKDTAFESVMITAASGSLTSGTQTETITQPPPDALVFTTAEQSVVAGTCSGKVTVQTRAQGSPRNVSSPTDVTPSATGLTFYSNNNCSTPASTVTINAGASSADFYFKGTTAGTVLLTAHSGTLTDATQNATITVGTPTLMVFTTSPLTTVAGSCAGPVTIQSQDDFGNASPVGSNKTLTLQVTPGDSNFRFYSDASCMTNINTSLTLSNGQSSASFYYRGEVARTLSLAVSGGGLTATPNQNHTIIPGSVAQLAFSTSTPPQTLLAGTCALRTIERQDALHNPVADTVDLSVALSGSTAAEFFSDASCTTAASPFTILTGASSASFYFKGYKGGDNATAPLTLTASASGLTSGTQVETLIPTVRRGACTMTGTSVNCTIAPTLSNINKAFLVFRASSTNPGSDKGNVRCRINSVSQVTCERNNSGGGAADVTINWEVAEFPAGVAVQHFSPACAASTTSVTLTPAVIMNESFLLLSSERGGPNQDSSILRLAELTSGSEAQVREPGTCGGADTNDLQAVDFPGASVQRGLSSIANGTASAQVTLSTPVVPERSILLYSYTTDVSGANLCNRAVRGEITGAGSTITFSRGAGDTTNCVAAQISSLSWEVVQFPPGTVVQQITQTTTATSVPLSLGQTVDPSRTIVIAGGQWASGQVQGEAQHTATDSIGEMRAQASLSDGSTLLLSRATGSGTATFTIYVVQLKP